jgi:FkbM family methyltransferase
MMVSYARNFEDVVLWRALSTVDRGFYIDVGAADPEHYSATKAFSDRGWTGINIDPIAHHIESLRRARPRDINIQAVAASRPGEATLHLIDLGGIVGTDFSTANKEVARLHAAEGRPWKAVQVAAVTLTEICEGHVEGPIHFLKIDVEGAERDVLSGIDLGRYRPWIIAIDAVAPGGGRPTHPEWEDLLTNADYGFAYFDGLNRFYVAAEHGDRLAPAISVPPNPRDRFVRASEIEANDRARLAEQAAVTALQERDAAHQQLNIACQERDAAYQAMFESERVAAFLGRERQSLADALQAKPRGLGTQIRRELQRANERRLRPLWRRLGFSKRS